MKYIIGLVGEKGSGKETFAKFLKEIIKNKTITHIRFSDILGETLTLWDLPKTRENYQHLAVIMDDGFGKGTLTHAISKKIQTTHSEIVVLDGVRWQSDIDLINTFPYHLLVYITADLPIRFERLKKRQEKKYEETTSFAQFMKEEKAKNELDIPIFGKKADYKIVNNGSMKDLKKQTEEFYKQFISQAQQDTDLL